MGRWKEVAAAAAAAAEEEEEEGGGRRGRGAVCSHAHQDEVVLGEP
jgi:hypothetical protein